MTLKNKKGKGNRKAQQQRRRERLKYLPKRQDEKHELIDGNWSHYPVAYCACHSAFLTQGLIDTHRCVQRHCSGFKEVFDHEN